MNNMPSGFTTFVKPRFFSAGSRPSWGVILAGLAGSVGVGCLVAKFSLAALLIIALTCVVFAMPFVDQLAVLTFWLLPYLILNLPTGGVTLKVPELTAYLFMAATLARALMRRERIALPPATFYVLLFLATLALSAAVSPRIPAPYWGGYSGLQSPNSRSFGLIFWLCLSWLLVVSLYHAVGRSPSLYRRCVCAHIWSGAIVSVIGIAAYVATLRGGSWGLAAVGHSRGMVFSGGGSFRLTGVSYEPLLFAFYLMTVIPVALTVAFYKQDWMPHRVVIGALFLMGIALLLTFSAGGWAALVVVLVFMIWLFRPQRIDYKKVLPFLLPALLPVLLVGVFYFLNPKMTNIINATVGKIASGGYKMRAEENLTGWRVFEAYPLLGVGPSMTTFYFPVYHPSVRSMDNDSISYFVNNLYITTLAEGGVVGFAALALCGIFGLAALWRPILRWGPRQVPILTGLTIALIGCAVQYWNTTNLFLIYFPALVGLACAGERLALTGPEQPPDTKALVKVGGA